MTLTVPAASAGERLDRFLATEASKAGPLSGLSRARLQALIDGGHVVVDGKPQKSAFRVKGGEEVRVVVPAAEPIALEPEPVALDVLYEDADIIAVAKPAGLVVHPGAGRTRGTLVNALLAHCQDLSGIGGARRPGIVHRLDRGTSGVLIAAKHDRAHAGLARQFAAREVVKRYVAFVLGTPTPRTRVLDTLYGRHPTARQRFTSKLTRGKRAVTRYTVAASGGGAARLDVLLGTGRTHQIRVHLADIGHPVLGDATYGGRRFGPLSDPEVREAAAALTHQALHAAVLEVRHPISGVPLVLKAALPEDLVRLARAIERADHRSA